MKRSYAPPGRPDGAAPKDERCQAVLLLRNAICRNRWTDEVMTKSGRPMRLCTQHQKLAQRREIDQLPLVEVPRS